MKVIVDVKIESAINLEGQIQIYQKLEKKELFVNFIIIVFHLKL